jgi:hypothetical protein
MAIVGAIIFAVSAAFSGDWGRAWDEVKAAAARALDLIVDLLRGMAGRVLDALAGLTDRLVAPFRDAFRIIQDLWNNTVGRLQLPSWLPGVGGQAATFAVPQGRALGAAPTGVGAGAGVSWAAAGITIVMPPGSDGYDVARQLTTFSRNVAPVANLNVAVR